MEVIQKYGPILFLCIGYGGVVYSIFTMFQSIGARNWKKIRANITSSRIDSSCDTDGCSYEAKIEYNYSYKNRDYTSSKIAFGYLGNSFKFLSKRIYKRFAYGSIPMIYVNPRNPKLAVLLAGIRPFHLFNIVFFIAFAVIATNIYSENSSNKALKRDNQPLALLTAGCPLACRYAQ